MGMHGRGGYNETDRARGCKDLPSTHVRLLTQAYRMRRKPCATAMCQGRGVMCLAASPAHKQTAFHMSTLPPGQSALWSLRAKRHLSATDPQLFSQEA